MEQEKRFDKIDDKLEEHEDKLDFLARTVAEHTERLDRIENKLGSMSSELGDMRISMATKEDMSKIMNTLDKIVGLYAKKDEEQTLLAHDQKNLTDRVEILEKDMRHVKPALGLA